jgi:hypothetical protein
MERRCEMIRKNMGRLDRGLRLVAGLALVPIVLFALSGWLSVLGVAVIVILLVTSVTGFCPGYVPFGVSTLHEGEKSAGVGRGHHAAHS